MKVIELSPIESSSQIFKKYGNNLLPTNSSDYPRGQEDTWMAQAP